jgi:hypothetical protein
MVGATLADVRRHRSKVEIAYRVVQRVQPAAKITCVPSKWQDEPLPLRICDIIIGCVDSVRTRHDLEAVTRRFLIPYLDIGLDVHVQPRASEPPRMAGQVALSMPGDRCLQCLGVIQERFLTDESRRYGDAGSRPQVVWANGILASTAVGLVIDLLSDWTQQVRSAVYLEYLGNEGIVRPSPRLEYAPEICQHYPLTHVGDPL